MNFGKKNHFKIFFIKKSYGRSLLDVHDILSPISVLASTYHSMCQILFLIFEQFFTEVLVQTLWMELQDSLGMCCQHVDPIFWGPGMIPYLFLLFLVIQFHSFRICFLIFFYIFIYYCKAQYTEFLLWVLKHLEFVTCMFEIRYCQLFPFITDLSQRSALSSRSDVIV